MLKTAVDTLNADKGLFVATNGQYLKRKTVKIGDAFYLTEDERREIIERACEGEDKLSFATFELGGINPSRFKTLCKLQKQYPNAEIFEVMGADKVHTLYKSSYAED
jgi:nicotinic acid mononucleotide adenylyltransferase